jgi:hypothetical protein
MAYADPVARNVMPGVIGLSSGLIRGGGRPCALNCICFRPLQARVTSPSYVFRFTEGIVDMEQMRKFSALWNSSSISQKGIVPVTAVNDNTLRFYVRQLMQPINNVSFLTHSNQPIRIRH